MRNTYAYVHAIILAMSHSATTVSAPLDNVTAACVAETMQALATPSRVRILSRLAAGPCTVTELIGAIEMTQSAVSQQLRVLRLLGLVVGERQGRNVLYALHDSHVAVLLSEAVSHAEHLRLAIIDTSPPAADRS